MTPNAARAKHPHAWKQIESQMDDFRKASDAVLIPLSAQVIEVRGRQELELLAVTDVVTRDSEQPAQGIVFRASLLERPALQLVT